jgi:hypothetical protein
MATTIHSILVESLREYGHGCTRDRIRKHISANFRDFVVKHGPVRYGKLLSAALKKGVSQGRLSFKQGLYNLAAEKKVRAPFR